MSERVLELTETALSFNAANYTIWYSLCLIQRLPLSFPFPVVFSQVDSVMCYQSKWSEIHNVPKLCTVP